VTVAEGSTQLIGQDVLEDADVENSEEVVDPLPADEDGDSLIEVDLAELEDVVVSQGEPADPVPGVAEALTLVSVISLSDAVNVTVPEIERGVIESPSELDDVVLETVKDVIESPSFKPNDEVLKIVRGIIESPSPELDDEVLKIVTGMIESPLPELDDVVLEIDRLVGVEVENSVRTLVLTSVVELPNDVERDVRVPVGTRQ